MCGRAKLPEDLSELKQDLHIAWDKLGDYAPRYDVAPATPMPIVTSAGGERTIEWMRWGLIPSWAKDEKLYEAFRPDIPAGVKGWGAAGNLKLDEIAALAD